MKDICRRRVAYVITLYACSGEEQIRDKLGPQIQKMNECIGAKLEKVKKPNLLTLTYRLSM